MVDDKKFSLSGQFLRLALLCLVIACVSGREVKVRLYLSPSSLEGPLTSRMNVTVRCTAVEVEDYYRRRQNRYQSSTRVLTRLGILMETEVASGKPPSGRSISSTRVLTRLRILMETESSTWRPVVTTSNLEDGLVHVDPAFEGLSAIGKIRPMEDTSELAVIWKGPTTDLVRQFRCDAITFDKKFQDAALYHWTDARMETSGLNGLDLARFAGVQRESLVAEADARLSDINGTADTDARRKFQADRAAVREMLTRLRIRLAEAAKSQEAKTEELAQYLEELSAGAREQTTEEMERVESRLTTAVAGSFLMVWPLGEYALPMPDTDCPYTVDRAWLRGYRLHHTESTDRNSDRLSPGNHLVSPTLARERAQNFVYQRFCSKRGGNSFGPTWPAGSYCVNKVGKCPSGFNQSTISWDEEDHDSSATTGGTVPDGKFDASSTRLVYCCRADGAASEPVDLPQAQPFYLYRHGSQCQAVRRMTVTEEFIFFDTENHNNGDGLEGQHPDVDIKNSGILLRLCYYQLG